MITKELFVASIEALQKQYLFDKKNTEVLGMMFGTEISGAYDTSVLSKAIITLLQQDFPADNDGHCAIEHFCYCQEFGKYAEGMNPADVYDNLRADFFIISEPTGSECLNHAEKTLKSLTEVDGKPEYTCSACINQIIVEGPEVLFLPVPENKSHE